MPAPAPARQDLRFPWEPESVNRANLTMNSLRQLLQQRVPTRGPQTLLIAAGALVGFAAQNSALEQGELLTARRDLVAPESLLLRQNEHKQRFLMGRWINAPLLLGYGHGFPLQRFVIQAAAAAGVGRNQFPDYWEMERRVVKDAQDGVFGTLGPGEGREQMARPVDMLKALWPTARRIMNAPMPLEMMDEPMMSEAHWATAMSVVSARLIASTADAVPPLVAADLVMEAAFIASKLDPDLVDPGRWTLGPSPRGLQIVRDDRRQAPRRIA
jgi:hypothetical protein